MTPAGAKENDMLTWLVLCGVMAIAGIVIIAACARSAQHSEGVDDTRDQ